MSRGPDAQETGPPGPRQWPGLGEARQLLRLLTSLLGSTSPAGKTHQASLRRCVS